MNVTGNDRDADFLLRNKCYLEIVMCDEEKNVLDGIGVFLQIKIF